MKSFMAIIGILAAFIGGCYAFWSSVFQNIHVRYRLTVEVRVNDEVKIGTSVIDVLYTITPDSFQSLGGAGGSLPQFDGYAPTVDLGKKGLLFLTFANGFGAPGNSSVAASRAPWASFNAYRLLAMARTMKSLFPLTVRKKKLLLGYFGNTGHAICHFLVYLNS